VSQLVNNLGAFASVGLFLLATLPIVLRFMLQGMIRKEIDRVVVDLARRMSKYERRLSRLEAKLYVRRRRQQRRR
jgi:hypothetical protein